MRHSAGCFIVATGYVEGEFMVHAVSRAVSRRRTAAMGSVAAAALTVVATVGVPSANATCASLFGLGSGGQCTSTVTSIAIAIGDNAEAHADGMLGAALTLGANATASTNAGALLNLAVNLAQNSLVNAGGIVSFAFAANSTNQTVLAGDGGYDAGNIGNFAVSLTSPEATRTIASGIGNLAVNFAGSGSVFARGVGLTTLNAVGLNSTLDNGALFNTIVNVVGNNNTIANLDNQGGIGNIAVNLVGSDNALFTSGSLAVAGAFGSTGQILTQTGPGVNVSFLRQAVPVASSRGLASRRSVAAAAVAAGPSVNAAAAAVAPRNASVRGNRTGR